MLGRRIADPAGIEGPPGAAEGLGLLDLDTVLTGDKQLREVRGREIASGEPIHGYEMHVGRTSGPALARPMLDLAGRPDGAVSPDGRIMGCYVHGLFAADDFRHAFLARLRERARLRRQVRAADRGHAGCARRPSRGARRSRRPARARPRAERSSNQATDRASRARSAAVSPQREDQQTEPATDVGWSRGGAAVAHPGVVDQLAGIAARTREPEAQRTCHRRLGPAGVRRAVVETHRARSARQPAPGVMPGRHSPAARIRNADRRAGSQLAASSRRAAKHPKCT